MRSKMMIVYAVAAFALAFGSAVVLNACGGASTSAAKGGNPCGAAENPCGGGNPCGGNPCGAAANPCGGNPCGAAANPCGGNPCGAAANPCGGNPCGGGAKVDAAKFVAPKGFKPNTGGLSDEKLLAKGAELWDDKSLSKNGALACSTCHKGDALFKPSFASAYPHAVEMVKEKAGVASVSAVEMVQFCMLVPMQTEPLDWNDVKLAALARLVTEKQKTFGAKK